MTMDTPILSPTALGPDMAGACMPDTRTAALPVRHASLAPAARRPAAPAQRCEPLLDPRGARVILGAADDPLGLAIPVVPSAITMFGPRGACQVGDGSLWVADTGHHRVLGWHRLPTCDGAPADLLIGQPAFDREGRNARGPVGAGTLNVPTGIAACGAGGIGLAVADAWNHRVLIWHRRPTRSQQPPDVVLGQTDPTVGEANRGADRPSANTLFWPYAVAWDGARLWVADTGNRRVLAWKGLPTRDGAPAELVLGQPDFEHRDENGGGAPDAGSLRWPHAIAFPVFPDCAAAAGLAASAGALAAADDARHGVAIADAGNNRLLVWRRPPAAHRAPCDGVIGQPDASLVEHNQGCYHPDAACLNMPYGVVAAGDRLIVADTANSRLLAWRMADLTRPGAAATALAAQPDWNSKGDNRWQPAARDSVCWPYNVALAGGDTLLVADSGNNRVLLWSLVAGTTDIAGSAPAAESVGRARGSSSATAADAAGAPASA